MPTRVLALAVLVALAFSPAGALAEITIVLPGERSIGSGLSWFGYAENDGETTDEAGPFTVQTNVTYVDPQGGEYAASSSIDSVIAPGHIDIGATGMVSSQFGVPSAGAGMALFNHIFEITRPGHARVRWTFVGAGAVQGGVSLEQLGQPALVSLSHEDSSGDVTVQLQPGQYHFYASASASAGNPWGLFDSSFQVHAQLDVVEESPIPALSGSALVLLAAALLGLAVIAMRRRNAV